MAVRPWFLSFILGLAPNDIRVSTSSGSLIRTASCNAVYPVINENPLMSAPEESAALITSMARSGFVG